MREKAHINVKNETIKLIGYGYGIKEDKIV